MKFPIISDTEREQKTRRISDISECEQICRIVSLFLSNSSLQNGILTMA